MSSLIDPKYWSDVGSGHHNDVTPTNVLFVGTTKVLHNLNSDQIIHISFCLFYISPSMKGKRNKCIQTIRWCNLNLIYI